MEPPPVPPTAPAPLPLRASRAAIANIMGWPAVTLLTAGYLALIARLTSFPFEDFPAHLARAEVLADLLFHHGRQWGGVFAFHWQPVPYLLHDLILASLVATLGTTAGGVVFNELLVLSLPCALLYYMHANRLAPQARPLVVLISLYLATDWFFLVGFAAFRLAVAILIVCIALADALRERWSPRLYGAYLAALFAGYLEHLTVPTFLIATLVVSGSVRLLFGRANLRAEMRLTAPVFLLLLVYFGLLAGPHHSASPGVYALHWGTVSGKVKGLQGELFRYGGRANRPMAALLAFCLLWPVRRELVSRRRLLAPPVLERIVLAAAALLAGGNLAYVGWHLEKDDAWMRGYRAVAAQVPRGSVVLPIFTGPSITVLPLPHANAFVLLDRDGLTPYLFAGNLGDPMSYFDYRKPPYAPNEQWYRLQEVWNRSPILTLGSEGQSYRWRFQYDPGEHDWQPAVVAPVSWGEVACEYPYIIATQPYDPTYIGVPTRTLAANSSAALLAVDRRACRPGSAAASTVTLPPPQVTY